MSECPGAGVRNGKVSFSKAGPPLFNVLMCFLDVFERIGGSKIARLMFVLIGKIWSRSFSSTNSLANL